ncbi:hypothetical protein [Atopobacter phocae]|uniref:hypothetical protein n=1 Tax=Atopobacter phocae TaxID=136492 RepID=UPI00046FEEF4|nr:hypothetical protein [Atopobacter phocae]
MDSFSALREEIYEHFNLYIYLILPTIVISLYFTATKLLEINLFNLELVDKHTLEISSILFGTLFTILGLYVTLPDNQSRKLMKHYGYDKIISRTLVIGILSSLLLIVLSITNLDSIQRLYLLLIAITETFILIYYFYNVTLFVMSDPGE